MSSKDAPTYLIRKAAGPRGEIGRSGLQHFGGVITEEWLRKLEGERGRRVFREMSDNDPTVGAIMFAVEMLLRNVEWRVEPYSDDPEHRERAEFVSSLVDDMSITWEDFISECLSMLTFGFAPFEIVYKRRGGPLENDPKNRSRHDDDKIGWRKLAIRSQDTLDRWEFDPEDGGVVGFWQRLIEGPTVFIPIEKALVFKTTSRKSNPEGRSILRNAFVPWFHKRRVEEAEAIGVERDLAGMPLIYLPPDTWEPAQAAKLAEYQRLVEHVKNDEQAGVLLPAVFDDQGNRIVEFTLMGTGSRRLFDTTAIASRYDRQIAQVALADFVMLGHEKVGSFALSSDKTALFSTALGAWLKEIAAVLNRHALPRLFALNGWPPNETPEFVPADVEDAEIVEFASAMAQLTAAGWLTPGSREDEEVVRERLNLPEPPDELFDPTTGMRTNPLTGEPAVPGMEPKPEPPVIVTPDGELAPGQPAKKPPFGKPNEQSGGKKPNPFAK
jgi:hypothetical protein